MEAKRGSYGEYVITEGMDRYIETRQAEPTSRVLDGSRDNGYWAEYEGYGTIDGVPVIAVYLLDYEEAEKEEADQYDWDKALSQGRIVVNVNGLTDAEYEELQKNNKLTKI